MYALKRLHRFQLDYDTILDYQVRYEVTNPSSFVFEFNWFLPFVFYVLQVKFNAQCIFLDTFKQFS